MERFTPIRVLLVEDNPADVEIATRALNKSKLLHELDVVRDGQEALDYLFHEGGHATNPPPSPDIILLDLNLPKVHGIEVLRRVRERHLQAAAGDRVRTVLPGSLGTQRWRAVPDNRCRRGCAGASCRPPVAGCCLAGLRVGAGRGRAARELPPRRSLASTGSGLS
jgi:CheY-like chemotaxis protein